MEPPPLVAQASDSRALSFEDLWFTVFDAVAEDLSTPALALLAGCSHGASGPFGDAALWTARLRARWGDDAGLTDDPRRAYARRDVCERWNLRPKPVANMSSNPLSSPSGVATSGKSKENVPPGILTPLSEQLSSRRRPVAASPLAPAAPAPAPPLDKCQTTRLRKDLFALMTRSDGRVTAFPERESDLSSWRARVSCPDGGGAHAGVTFSLSLTFTATGAASASGGALPAVEVLSPACYHPNVDPQSGALCAAALRRRCAPVAPVAELLQAVLSLLQQPCFAVRPLHKEAAAAWYAAPQERRLKAQGFTYLQAQLQGLALR